MEQNKLKKISAFIGCFVLVLPLLSYGFDCNKPDFGAKLEDLNKKGFFVKYMENGGISYYKYTGPCRPTIHETATMDIGYAFIANKLYARIVNLTTRKQLIEKVKNEIVKKVSRQIGTAPYEIKQDGDWWLYQWFNEKDNLKFKLKYNWKKGEGKCAFYYEPLRAELPGLKEEDDPVFLVQYSDIFVTW
jgi:hypothetical protein